MFASPERWAIDGHCCASIGVVEFLVWRAGKQLGDRNLAAVVLDIAFIQQTGFDVTPAGRIENLFFDKVH